MTLTSGFYSRPGLCSTHFLHQHPADIMRKDFAIVLESARFTRLTAAMEKGSQNWCLLIAVGIAASVRVRVAWVVEWNWGKG